MSEDSTSSGVTQSNSQPGTINFIRKLFPFLRWFKNYSGVHLRVDFISGLTVALVLIPQSMAYAQLADLPAYFGLYAAFLPPVIAALFGSSNQLATGPVAVVSLMTSTALAPLATAGSESFIAYAIILALLVGLFQFTLGVLKLGLVVNFLSHPVVNGFTNAAALIIATSQLSKLFGVHIDKAEHHYETVYNVIKAALVSTHLPTLAFAILSFTIMIALKKINRRIPNVLVAVSVTILISWATGFEKNEKINISNVETADVRENIRLFNTFVNQISQKSDTKIHLSKRIKETMNSHEAVSVKVLDLQHEFAVADLEITELKENIKELKVRLRQYKFSLVKGGNDEYAVFLKDQAPSGTGRRTWYLKIGNGNLDEKSLVFTGGGAVVGNIPSGLPEIKTPKINFSIMFDLMSMAIIISLLGFMEAISIAKAMAARTGQRLDPNQELIGQGLANIFGSFAQSYPVSGSFSRSAVNIQSGAVTGMSSVFSSGVVLITLLFFTPLLYHLPQAVLASIIMMAVIGLLNIRGFIHAWEAQKYDGVIAIVSFVCTLAFAPHLDKGIMIGVALSLGNLMFRHIKPDMAILSKYGEGIFRNAERRGLHKCKHIAVVRFNNALFFANVAYLEEQILDLVASMPELKHVHIVGNGINEMDASGEEMLSLLVTRLREADYDFSMSGLNDAVLDVMRRTHLYEKIGEDHIYGNVAIAIRRIHNQTHKDSDEGDCPLIDVHFKGLPVSPEVKKRMQQSDKQSSGV